ncbi:hypothetical protein SSS_06197 [Sarcoptes scabiei]|nr:hypothetical protein SSS_06197 [Sarcoptes scabiei]
MMSLDQSLYNDEDSVQKQLTSNQMSKNVYEDEELDFEEDDLMIKSKSADSNSKSDQDEGEFEESEDIKPSSNKVKIPKEKDEGEIDSDDELEEGEVKEENSDSGNEAAPTKDQNIESAKPQQIENRIIQNKRAILPRPLNDRKNYYINNHSNPFYPPHQNFLRFPIMRNDRYNNNNNNNIRLREQSSSNQSHSSESAWERGLKQARELISRASKRKELEEDAENKRLNPVPTKIDRSPDSKDKRRRLSQISSSEDEMERRHRLAYDAAPWNNQSSYHGYRQHTSPPQQSFFGSRRVSARVDPSAETYRDPWRRSKSPKISSIRDRKDDLDAHYEKLSRNRKSRSHSMSSLSSICSTSSNFSGSDKSSGRKLPYSRPKVRLDKTNG